MKARIAEITITRGGGKGVELKRRSTLSGTRKQVLSELKALARKGRYRSVFGAIDDSTGRLIDARDVVERGGRKTSVRISPKTRGPVRRAIGRLVRKAYKVRLKKARKTSKRKTSKKNCGRRTTRNARRRRTSRRPSRRRRTSRRTSRRRR